MADGHVYEHSRRRLGAGPITAFERNAPRILRPLAGGAVGASIIVLFLALRGGPPMDEIDMVTGTQRGGWNRLEDVHLLIVVNAAVVAAIAANFLAEWIHHWLEISIAAAICGMLIALRQLGDLGDGGRAALLALSIISAAAVPAIAAYDIRTRNCRAGY